MMKTEMHWLALDFSKDWKWKSLEKQLFEQNMENPSGNRWISKIQCVAWISQFESSWISIDEDFKNSKFRLPGWYE